MGSSLDINHSRDDSSSSVASPSNGVIRSETFDTFKSKSKASRTNTGIDDNISFAHANTLDEVWSQQNLLSLDGGGIRGYWTLLVVQGLMEAIATEEDKLGEVVNGSFTPQPFPPGATQGPLEDEEKDEYDRAGGNETSKPMFYRDSRKFLPCHYFDYICGSSTGGLIAIMLGRFRMTVFDCLHEYKTMGHKIFGKPRLISQRNLGVPWPKYSATAMEKALKDVTARRCEFITAFQSQKTSSGFSKKTLYLIRSYDHEEKEDLSLQQLNQRKNTGALRKAVRKNFGQADALEIWQVARAATAAPFYFKEIAVKRHDIAGTTKTYFSDGGFGYTNNPTKEGILEIESLHGNANIGVVVSIGTARGTKPTGRGLFSHIEKAFEGLTDPEVIHNNLEGREFYWRFNDVNKGLDVALDEWRPNGMFSKHPGQKTLAAIQAAFDSWVAKRENSRQMKKCAKQLVKRRIRRAENGARWDAYSTGAEYPCTYSECNNARFEDKNALKAHLRVTHSTDEDGVAKAVGRMTKRWQYQTLPQP